MCFCSEKIAKIFLWISIFMIPAFIVLMVLSIVYLYLPIMNQYVTSTCYVATCTDKSITCCQTFLGSNDCTTNTYPQVSFTLLLNNGSTYTKTEIHNCNGPIGQDDWVYDNMCSDPNLKTLPCYYDDQDILDSLNLSDVYQTLPPLGVAAICSCVIILIGWIVYLFFYFKKYRCA